MPHRSLLTRSLAVLMLLCGVQTARAETLTVAYFLEWPMPFQYAKVKGLYEDALGVDVVWRAFDTGTAMSAAMASGDVQIALSQGVPPFVVAVSAGQDLQVVDVAVSYADNDNCVVQDSLEITAANARELQGKKVAVPLGTAAHYGFLKQMAHFGVDVSTMSVIDMAPPDSAAAFAQGSLDMACGWGGSLRKMKESGTTLLTGAEKEELGIRVFDVTSVSSSFASENPELIANFLKVTAQMNALYLTDSEEMLPVIARDAGMDRDAAREQLNSFEFPTVEEQLSDKWLGGDTQMFLKEVADFFFTTGDLQEVRDNYAEAVNTVPLQQARGL